MIGQYLLNAPSRAARRKGNAARDARRWTHAAKAYRRYLERRPDDAAIWIQLGHALAESGQYFDADHAYRTADALAPNDADLALCRGHLAWRREDLAAARELYELSVSIDGNPAARQSLEQLDEALGSAAPEESHIVEPDSADHVPVPEEAPPIETEIADIPAAREPDIAGEPGPPLHGRYESWIHRTVTGVVMGEPDETPVVEFRVEGRVVGRARAWLRRSEPREHGFKAFLDIHGHEVWVSAYLLPSGVELEGSPVLVHPEPPRVAPLSPASAARYQIVKQLRPFGDIALFVTHSRLGKLKPHVLPYIRSLKAQGVDVLLIIAADRPADVPRDVLDNVAGVIVRENVGYDFAAWAHVFRLYPELFAASLLLLVNDSVILSNNQGSCSELFRRVRESDADLIGLTESHEYGWHLQSYFLACKPPLLSSWAFHRFFNEVNILASKDDIVRAYEVPFAEAMEAHGHVVETLFPSHLAINPVLFGWRDLVARGFPFAKLLLLRGLFPEAEVDGWHQTLADAGFDISLISSSIAAAEEYGPPGAHAALVARSCPDEGAPVKPIRVSFIGPWNYDNGLGQASRALIGALRRAGILLNLHPVKKPFHIHRPVSPPVDIIDFHGEPDIVIVHLNPDSWHLLSDDQMHLVRTARRRIGYWVWEMGHVPDSWRNEFFSVDRIWAPSTYCADVFATESRVPVDVIPHPVAILPPAITERGAVLKMFGVDSTKRVILYIFDGSSYLVRKNPAALIRAFAMSGLAARGWVLVLKTKYLMDRPSEGAALEALALGVEGVHLINRPLNSTMMRALMTASDIYASPHCSEGFGLTVAEAMAAGKAVVASDFSGTRDFLDPACGYPVETTPWTLEEDYGHYTAGGAWSRVDEAALARALVDAATDIDSGDGRRREAAPAKISALLSFDAVAQRIAKSLADTLSEPPVMPIFRRIYSTLDHGVAFDAADLGDAISAIPLEPDGSLSGLPDDLPLDPDRWFAFAPRDAVISPFFERIVLTSALERPDVAIFYADDVAIGAPRASDQLRLKPDFDITLLAAQDYIGWPVIVRGSALARLGGTDAGCGPAVLTDLLLRAHDEGLAIARIPQILVAHRGDRPLVSPDDRRAVLERRPRFRDHDILDGAAPGLLSVKKRFMEAPPVTLLIPTRRSAHPDGGTYVERFLDRIAEADWPMDRLEVLVGDDVAGEVDWAGRQWPFTLRRIETPRPPGEPFNYAAKMNILWRAATTEQIVFLNDDLQPCHAGWLHALQTFAVDDTVGGVGARLVYPDGRLQHAGVVPVYPGVAHVWLGRRHADRSYQEWALAQREWSMVTGAVFATRRSLMDRAGGFDEGFSLEFNDIDLCLRLRSMGYRIVYNPEAELIHAEKASRGEVPPPGQEIARFLLRWRQWLDTDPSFHPRYRCDHLELLPSEEVMPWYH